MSELLQHAARRAEGDPWLVAGRWRARGGTLTSLAEALACDEATAARAGLCRAPRPGEDLDAWTARVAQYLRLDPARLRDVARTLELERPS